DLPDIESASDHPGSAVPITSSERDPGKPSTSHRLVSQRLDHGALASLRPPGLLVDEPLEPRCQSEAERLGLPHRHDHSVVEQLHRSEQLWLWAAASAAPVADLGAALAG